MRKALRGKIVVLPNVKRGEVEEGGSVSGGDRREIRKKGTSFRGDLGGTRRMKAERVCVNFEKRRRESTSFNVYWGKYNRVGRGYGGREQKKDLLPFEGKDRGRRNSLSSESREKNGRL